ncbi:MAG: zinc-binding dehydrogenase [Chitinophagales bacterium]
MSETTVRGRAMVLEEFGRPLVPREFEVTLTGGEAVVRLAAAGLCGSDVHMQRGEDPRTPLPLILGHEGVGHLEVVPPGLTDISGRPLAEGDLVMWNRGISCGHCYWCAVKRTPALCPSRKTWGINVSSGVYPYLNGCYAERIVLGPGTDFIKIDAAKVPDPAVLVAAGCSGATVAHGYELVRPEVGDVVVVQGPGPVGIFAAAFALRHGASAVVVIGGSEARLQMAERFGALTLNRRTTSEAERRAFVAELTAGRGADIVVEASGTTAAITEGLGLVRRGGAYLSLGIAVPEGPVTIDPFADLNSRNIRFQGSWVSDTRHTVEAVDLVVRQPELFAPLVTHRFPLAEANEALAAMAGRECVKAVLVP